MSLISLNMPRVALVYRVCNEVLISVLQLCLAAVHTPCLCLAFLQGIQQQMKCSIRTRTNCKYSILSQWFLSDTHTLIHPHPVTLTLTHTHILTLSLTLMQIMLKHSPGGHRAKNSIYTFCVLLLVLLLLQFLLLSKPKKTVANSSKLQTAAVWVMPLSLHVCVCVPLAKPHVIDGARPTPLGSCRSCGGRWRWPKQQLP